MLRLRTAIGRYPNTQPLIDGRLRSTRLSLDHVEITPVNRAFRPMITQLSFDVSEMALVTLMLARAMGVPVVGIPVVLMRQSAHALLGVRADALLMEPKDLSGARLGVRAYTQTTGTWVRGILQHQFGVDLHTLRWLTFEDAHVDGFVDPPSCERAGEGVTLQQALTSDQVQAAIGLEPNPSWRPLLDDSARAEAEFQAQLGMLPVNHTLVVKQDLADQYPWLTRELYELFAPAAAESLAGLETLRPGVELLARFAFEQGIIPSPQRAEALFDALS